MGSEFAFEDLGSQEVEKYTWKYLRDEAIDGREAYVVERIPVNKRSGYTRQVVWTDKAELYPIKMDFYDRKKSLLKTLTFADYNQYKDKFWRAHDMLMVNHQTGKKTQLLWSDITYNNDFSDRDFTKNSLQRLR